MWLADKCSSVKKPAHNGLFLVQKYKIQLLYSLNCQTKTINCYYKFSTSKCVKSHIHEWINRIHIYWIFIIIIRYHVFCIYDFYVFDIWKTNRKCCCSSNVLDCGDDIAKLKLHFECTYLLQVMQPFLTYSLKISCSYCHDFKCFAIGRVFGLKNPGYFTIIKIWNMICTEEEQFFIFPWNIIFSCGWPWIQRKNYLILDGALRSHPPSSNLRRRFWFTWWIGFVRHCCQLRLSLQSSRHCAHNLLNPSYVYCSYWKQRYKFD